MSMVKAHHAVGTVGGKIYVCGASTPTSAYNLFEAYDPPSNTWSIKTSHPTDCKEAGHDRMTHQWRTQVTSY